MKDGHTLCSTHTVTGVNQGTGVTYCTCGLNTPGGPWCVHKVAAYYYNGLRHRIPKKYKCPWSVQQLRQKLVEKIPVTGTKRPVRIRKMSQLIATVSYQLLVILNIQYFQIITKQVYIIIIIAILFSRSCLLCIRTV